MHFGFTVLLKTTFIIIKNIGIFLCEEMKLFLINLSKNTHGGNRIKDCWNKASTPKSARLLQVEQSSPLNKLKPSFDYFARFKKKIENNSP